MKRSQDVSVVPLRLKLLVAQPRPIDTGILQHHEDLLSRDHLIEMTHLLYRRRLP